MYIYIYKIYTFYIIYTCNIHRESTGIKYENYQTTNKLHKY